MLKLSYLLLIFNFIFASNNINSIKNIYSENGWNIASIDNKNIIYKLIDNSKSIPIILMLEKINKHYLLSLITNNDNYHFKYNTLAYIIFDNDNRYHLNTDSKHASLLVENDFIEDLKKNNNLTIKFTSKNGVKRNFKISLNNSSLILDKYINIIPSENEDSDIEINK